MILVLLSINSKLDMVRKIQLTAMSSRNDIFELRNQTDFNIKLWSIET